MSQHQITSLAARMSRRDIIRLGTISALGLGLRNVASLRMLHASDSVAPRAKSCILIWLDGGPSHLETFDMKPEAPVEVRGPLATISTSLPGVGLSECLPETAKILDRIAIVRSMTSPLGEHNFGTHYMMTGYKPTPVLEYPTYGGVVSHLHSTNSVLPPHIAIPEFRVGGGRLSGGGYLPDSVRPFSIGGDPARSDFKVHDLDLGAGLTRERVTRRQRYVEHIDRLGELSQIASDGTSDLDRAIELITSESTSKAFDLDAESVELRDRYGRKTIGQSCLLARRLVEHGVPFVTINNRGWDTHNDLYTRLKEGYTGAKSPVGLIPSLDQAFSSLVSDLDDRGMLDETLVLVMGEFGRTPKLNTSGGRDHWPRVFSVALAGGGIKGGQVVGESDATGESPKDRPVTPSDLAATIYSLLGIDPQLELKTGDGRPVRLTPHDSSVIQELTG